MSREITSFIDPGTGSVNKKYFTSMFDPTAEIVSIDIDSRCANLVITDKSNFDKEYGHYQPAFSNYRTVEVVKPDGTTDTYSSILEASSSYYIQPASSSLTINIPLGGVDGAYEIRLTNIPTWNENEQYQAYDSNPVLFAQEDIVVNVVGTDIKFYRCIENHSSGSTFEPGVGGSWQDNWVEITDGNYLLTDGYSKYTDTEVVLVHCSLDTCIQNLTNKLFCSSNKIDFCDKELMCHNNEYLKFLKLYSLRAAMDTIYRNNADSGTVNDIIAISDRICECETFDC
tara:strand:+ start:11889 stop:12743 length:855 start_codon:yes stop_codon:yes gene_type:complete